MTTVLSGPPSPVAAKIANNNESENASIAQEKPEEKAVDEPKEDKENKETKQDEVYDIPIGEYCEDI